MANMNLHPHYPEDEYISPAEEQAAELFAGALARLDAGESVESVLEGLPDSVAMELRAMLELGEFMMTMQELPLPVRTTSRVSARRNEFMNQVALEKTRQELELPLAAATPPRYIATPGAAPNRSRQSAGASWWRQLQEAFTFGNMRLAPILATLVIALTSVFGLWRVSIASLPGDLVYPIKAWMQMMNLSLASPENLEAAATEASATVQADIAESARRAEHNAANRATAIANVRQETVFLVFEGYDGKLLKFGDIRVVPSYQPTAGLDITAPMTIKGDLQPGAPVWLTIQILPGQADIVQGVLAEVQEAEAPLAPQPTPIVCTPQRPAGWTNYTVARGDTLSALSQNTDVSIRAIAGANCLDSDVILAGQLLYLPNMARVQPAPLAPAATSAEEVQPAAVPAAP